MDNQKGFVLVLTMMLITVMGILLASYFTIANLELKGLYSSHNYEKAFFAAEGGLNARAEEFRQQFVYFSQPSGTSPVEENACEGSNLGTGDYLCKDYVFGGQTVTTYVIQQYEDEANKITVPTGEPFAGLVAFEYQYDVISTAKNPSKEIGSILGLRFKSRVVPMFQFAAFYDKDLEITNGEDMLVDGSIHANGNVYLGPLGSGDDLVINGQVTCSGDIWRGKKHTNDCSSSANIYVIHGDPIEFNNPSGNFMSEVKSDDFTEFGVSSKYNCVSSQRTNLGAKDFSEWNNQIIQNVEPVEIPDIASTFPPWGDPTPADPDPGTPYWDSADVRLVLKLDGSDNIDTSNSLTGVELRTSINGLMSTEQALLDACVGLISGRVVNGHQNTFWDQLRQADITMIDVDLENLLTCLDTHSIVNFADSSHGGHVLYFTVEGNNSACDYDNASYDCANSYGVRIKNADNLIDLGAMNGITIITDLPIYMSGDFNLENASSDKLPASIYSDALTVLSNKWDDGDTDSNGRTYDQNSQWSQGRSSSYWDNDMLLRNANDTRINAALVSGTITTGNADGAGGHSNNPNSAGLNNYPRLLEDWGGPNATLTIEGAFVSLSKTRRAKALNSSGSNYGIQTNYHYTIPTRSFIFDQDFGDPDNLPPLAMSFVYLKQLFFTRDFEQ